MLDQYWRTSVSPGVGSAAGAPAVSGADGEVRGGVMPDPPSRFAAFIAELRRRRVFRVAAVNAGGCTCMNVFPSGNRCLCVEAFK